MQVQQCDSEHRGAGTDEEVVINPPASASHSSLLDDDSTLSFLAAKVIGASASCLVNLEGHFMQNSRVEAIAPTVSNPELSL